MTTWVNWLRTDFRAACNWCKGVDNEKIVMVQRDDGTHTTNAEQVHALVAQAWIPIFKLHELGTQPTWSQFEAAFARCECAMKGASAPGADGWRVAEFQLLPLQLFEKLAHVLNLVEEIGKWATSLLCGLISLIQKAVPRKLMPIGLMAFVCRLWASLRIRDILLW